MEVEKGLSTCPEPSLIGPPRSRCRGAPVAPHFCKLPASTRKKPRCTKSPLQPQNSSQPVLNQSSRLLGLWAPTFPVQQAGDSLGELLENPASQECNPNCSQKPALPSAYFPSDMLHLIFFFFQLRRQSFNPTKTCNFSNALKTDPQLQRPTPCPKPGRNETAWD